MSNGYKKYLFKIRLNKIIVLLVQLFILIFFLLLWQYLSDNNYINSFITSSPKRVLSTIIGLYRSNNLFNNIWVTIYETIVSFIIATLLGIVIATILWSNKFIARVIDPYLTVINSLPKVSMGPILIIWLGANRWSIIVMALFISVIITIINIYNGFINVDKNKINLLKSFGGNRYQIFKYLILPGNYNTIISSLKINISMCLIGLLPPVGEKIFFNKCYSRY